VVYTGVVVGRLIAAPDVSTVGTHPEMHPTGTDPKAFLATGGGRPDRCDLGRDVRAVLVHRLRLAFVRAARRAPIILVM
jgi:hypothetical protein